MNYLFTSLTVCLLISQFHQAELSRNYDWARREIAVFDTVSFDFILHSALLPTSISQFDSLVNCSTAETLCLQTSNLALNLPRSCDFGSNGRKGWPSTLLQIGQTRRHITPHNILGDQTAIVMDKRYPFIVYEYQPLRGITAIAFDRSAWLGRAVKVDFRSAVRNGDYERLRGKDISYEKLRTLDPFGACHAD